MSDYMTSHEYATELKKLADEMLACEDFKLGWSSSTVTVGVRAERQELLAFARHLKPLRKRYEGDEIRLDFGSGLITAKLTAKRTVACRVIRPAQPAVYECDPLLTPEEEATL